MGTRQRPCYIIYIGTSSIFRVPKIIFRFNSNSIHYKNRWFYNSFQLISLLLEIIFQLNSDSSHHGKDSMNSTQFQFRELSWARLTKLNQFVHHWLLVIFFLQSILIILLMDKERRFLTNLNYGINLHLALWCVHQHPKNMARKRFAEMKYSLWK